MVLDEHRDFWLPLGGIRERNNDLLRSVALLLDRVARNRVGGLGLCRRGDLAVEKGAIQEE